MSFANQALSAEFVIQNAGTLDRKVYPVPEEIDKEIARLKLETMGVRIDQLTEEQAKYLDSWNEVHNGEPGFPRWPPLVTPRGFGVVLTERAKPGSVSYAVRAAGLVNRRVLI